MQAMAREKRRCEVSTLPNTLSALLRLAVADAQAAAQMPGVKLSMTTWYERRSDNNGETSECHVCMAGAVVVRTLYQGTDGDWNTYIGFIRNTDTRRGLDAIDDMRTGDFHNAAEVISQDVSEGQFDALTQAEELVSRYYIHELDGGRATWDTYLVVAGMLENVGL